MDRPNTFERRRDQLQSSDTVLEMAKRHQHAAKPK
jgi:hypothetical protein